MSQTIKTLGIDQLGLHERLQLVEDIWDSIAEDVESMPIPDWHREELDRRIAAHEADPHAGSSWEAVKERLRLKKAERSS